MSPEPTGPMLLLIAVLGLCAGSFLNVVIVRLGHVDWQQRRSLGGRSACPRCGATIRWHDNIPVASWLVLRGRCGSCRAPISPRYPIVELATSALWVLVAVVTPELSDLVTGLVFVSLLVPVTAIDLEHRIIPDELNYAAVWLGLACSLGLGPRPRFLAGYGWWWVEVLASGAAAAAFLLLPALVTRGRGMGAGDVKLAFALGAFLGAPVAAAMMAGFALALVPSIVVLARRGVRAGRRTAIPFGPFLAGGGIIGWCVGPQLLDAYLRLGT